MFSSRFCEKLDPIRKKLKVRPSSVDPLGNSFCLLLSVLSISNSNYTTVYETLFRTLLSKSISKSVKYLNSLRYAQRTIEADPVFRVHLFFFCI